MIDEVIINDNSKCVFTYLPKLESFKNGTSYKFKRGINIIIGKNGCGKSTLLKIISNFMLCGDSIQSRFSYNGAEDRYRTKRKFYVGDKFMDGVDVKSDYFLKAFRMIPSIEQDNDCVSNIDDIRLRLTSSGLSMGESMLNAEKILLSIMFNDKTDYNFPIKDVEFYKNELTDNLIDYYNRNRVNIKNNERYVTLIMDEPDRNLDIKNIDDVYTMLSYEKEMTQTIVAIHNPILIYKLSKLDYINFIEMSDGYLNQVTNLIKNL